MQALIDENLIKEIADYVTDLLKQAIIDNRQNATGRTIAAIRNEAGSQHFEVFGPHHIGALQYGRGPTGSGEGGVLYERILEWVQAKGIRFEDSIRKSKYTIEERTAKTITYFIHKRGTRLFYTGETYDGVKDPILRIFTPELVKAIQEKVFASVRARVSSEVFASLSHLRT